MAAFVDCVVGVGFVPWDVIEGLGTLVPVLGEEIVLESND